MKKVAFYLGAAIMVASGIAFIGFGIYAVENWDFSGIGYIIASLLISAVSALFCSEVID